MRSGLETFDGWDQIGGEAAFVDAGVGAGCECAREKHGWVVLAHDHDFSGGHFVAKDACDFESAQAWHADVEKDDIRYEFDGALNGVGSIFRFSADFPTGRGREDVLYTAPHGLAVISDQDSHGLGRTSSTREVITE